MDSLNEKYFSIKISNVSLTTKNDVEKEYPLLNIHIWDIPNLEAIKTIMSDIDETSKNIDKEYISLVDFTGLKVNKILQKIIVYGMEKFYKGVLKVSNPSLISFIILPDDPDASNLEGSLTTINDYNDSEYNYNFVFISDPKEVITHASKILE